MTVRIAAGRFVGGRLEPSVETLLYRVLSMLVRSRPGISTSRAHLAVAHELLRIGPGLVSRAVVARRLDVLRGGRALPLAVHVPIDGRRDGRLLVSLEGRVVISRGRARIEDLIVDVSRPLHEVRHATAPRPLAPEGRHDAVSDRMRRRRALEEGGWLRTPRDLEAALRRNGGTMSLSDVWRACGSPNRGIRLVGALERMGLVRVVGDAPDRASHIRLLSWR